jgi:hypothetical protein
MFVVLRPEPAQWNLVIRRGGDCVYFGPLVPKRHQGVRGYYMPCANAHGTDSASQDEVRKQFVCSWKAHSVSGVVRHISLKICCGWHEDRRNNRPSLYRKRNDVLDALRVKPATNALRMTPQHMGVL